MKNLVKSKIFRLVIMPLLLAGGGILLTAYHISSLSGFTILTEYHSQQEFTFFSEEQLYSGDKVAGKFKALDNHLGIVAVRFNTYNRINDDRVKFRIREAGQEKWYYENTYAVDQFQPNQLFTFGFPVITDSASKLYEFEIYSQNGEQGTAVSVSSLEPVYITQYQYPKHEVVSSLGSGISFIQKKILAYLTIPEFRFTALVYFLPFMGYSIWQFFLQRYLANKHIVVLVLPLLLVADSFYITHSDDLALLILCGVILVLFLQYRIMSRITYIFALMLLLLVPIILGFGNEFVGQNLAMWAYLLMVIGIIQALIELKRGNDGLVDYIEFFRKFLSTITKMKK